jgi:hypothetical protein
MTPEEYMAKQGEAAGKFARTGGVPLPSTELIHEWSETNRKQACRDCPNDDECAEWGNNAQCPAKLRLAYKHAYRKACNAA